MIPLFLAGVFLAGCTAPALPACKKECPTVLASMQPLASHDVRWADCEGAVGSIAVPRSGIEPLVPSAFGLLDASPVTVDVVFEALKCRRATAEQSIIDAAGLFHAFVRVRPLNASWSPELPSHFTLDMIAVGNGVADHLARLGVASVSGTLRADATGPARQWTFEAAGVQADLSFSTTAPSGTGGKFDRHAYEWTQQADGLARILVDKAFGYDSLPRQYGTLTLAGMRTTTGSPACCLPWEGQAYLEDQEVWSDGRLFHA